MTDMFSPFQWLINLDERIRMARRVSKDEGPYKIPDGPPQEWPEESLAVMASWSHARRLEEEEGDQGSRATELPEQHAGVGEEHKEIPDPWK